MMGLTSRQCEAVGFIARFQAAKGFSPSRREIGEALGLRGMACAQRLVMGLVERGAIRILPDRHRAIEILIPVPVSEAGETGSAGLSGFGLKPRQQDALRFITGYVERNGVPPSYSEIAAGIGTSPKGKNYIRRILGALEKAGAIACSWHQGRAIAVLKPLPIPRAPDGEPLHFVRIGGQG